MSWKIELYRAFFVAFGAMEIIQNTRFLVLKSGLDRARKQHGEIPKDVSEKNIRIKVICMLVSGIAFFVIGLASFVLHQPLNLCMQISLILFAVYAFIEAVYYRYRNTFGSFAVALALLIIFTIPW